MNFNDMRPIEQLAVAQALYKRIGEIVGTRSAGNLRANVDAHYKELYETDGLTSSAVRIGPSKVGTLSVIAKESKDKMVVDQVDADAFESWAQDEDGAANACIAWMLADPKRREAFCKYVIETTGVVPDGIRVRTAKPVTKLETRLVVDPEKVAAALGPALPSTVAGLLEGGA